MGVVGSKSPLERRNTVLRRSQRKSIHGVKSKTDKLIKDIKKFKGVNEESSDYLDLKARIEHLERDLHGQAKHLQPQVRQIHDVTLKKTKECHQILADKLNENQKKRAEKEAAKANKDADEVTTIVTPDDKEEERSDGDDVFIEEINEEPEEAKLQNKTQTVELKLMQVEPIQESPQLNKRVSFKKLGVAVMPGSMMEALERKTQEMNLNIEHKVTVIRDKIETLEEEISQFVGKRNGKYYNKISEQLNSYSNELIHIQTPDEAIDEQIKLCLNYIASCLSFLDDKAIDDDDDNDDESDDEDDDGSDTNTTPQISNIQRNSNSSGVDNSLSPRTMRTTYI